MLLARPRYEVLPTPATEELVVAHLDRDVTLTVTSSPRRGLEATLQLAERLARLGYPTVPHLAARQVVDASHLAEIVSRLRAVGIDDVFVPAGDADAPAGEFQTAYEMLRALDELGQPFSQRGVTAYPESHPSISDDVTVQSMWEKRHYATYLVSNMCFNPSVLRRWIRRVRARGVELPLYLGLAGPVEQAKLVRVATRIGVADSARFASGHLRSVLRLGAPGAYSPTRLLEQLDATLTNPASRVAGLHLFTFNQVAETEAWRRNLLARRATALADD